MSSVQATADTRAPSQSTPQEGKPKAYVRIAKPGEYDEAAWVLARAYTHDPALNWFGSVKELFPAEHKLDDFKSVPKKYCWGKEER